MRGVSDRAFGPGPQVLVLRLSAGDFFGEIALLSGKPRQATVRAVGDVSVLVLNREVFTRLCGPLVQILRSVTAIM